MALARWLRRVSEHQLLVAAQTVVARRYGVAPPPPPTGVNLFWQKVYAPLYHRLPWRLRAKAMRLMPGSHRRRWTPRPPSGGPAV